MENRKTMKLDEAIKILKNHNKWRRGDDNYILGSPEKLGIAIDLVIKFVEKECDKNGKKK